MVANSQAAVVAAGLVLLCGSALADQALSLFEAGADLSPEEVAALEETLLADPEDASVRARLLGYYSDLDLYWDKAAQEQSDKHTP